MLFDGKRPRIETEFETCTSQEDCSRQNGGTEASHWEREQLSNVNGDSQCWVPRRKELVEASQSCSPDQTDNPGPNGPARHVWVVNIGEDCTNLAVDGVAMEDSSD